MFQALPSLSSVALCLSLLAGESRDTLPAGTFLEARNAAVFAGACHYNAELVNSGDRALAAWSFERGSWEGVELAGACAVVALDAQRNLTLEGARRRAVLYLDEGSSAEQQVAVASLFRARYGELMGELVAIRRARIELAIDADGYLLAVEGVARLEGLAMPDRACCSMPESVWYRPLLEDDPATRTEGVLVGFTEALTYHDARRDEETPAAPRWSRYGENDAFLGRFSLGAQSPKID